MKTRTQTHPFNGAGPACFEFGTSNYKGSGNHNPYRWHLIRIMMKRNKEEQSKHNKYAHYILFINTKRVRNTEIILIFVRVERRVFLKTLTNTA